LKAHPDAILDLRGSFIPVAMLEVTTIFSEMKAGGIMEILVGDQETKANLFRVLRAYPYELLHVNESNSVFLVKLKKEQKKAGCTEVRAGARPAAARDSGKKTMCRSRWGTQIEEEERMTEANLNSIEVASTVDARGSACPGPLLEAKKGIGKVEVGEVLEILSGDRGTRNDIPAWAGKVGHEYLGVLESDGYDRLFVRRNK
jgi:tRNA 2-thiouridine synthesizing protein A